MPRGAQAPTGLRPPPRGTMLDVLQIVSPIFLAIAVGYGFVRSGIIGRDAVRGAGSVVLYVALPALVINALLRYPLGDLFDPRFLLVYGGASALVFCIGFVVARFVQHGSVQRAAMAALGASSSNSGFIGYPLAALVVGSPAVVALALCMLVENLLVIPAALALAETGAREGASPRAALQASAARLARNPIILAILLGVVLSLAGLRPPAPVQKTIDLFAAAAAPMALFVIGGSLVGLRARGLVAPAAPIVAGKLLLHPLAVALALLLVPGVDPSLRTAAIVMASVPMLSVYPLFGQRYGLEEMCSAALMAATVVSVATVSAIIWLITR